MKRSVAPAPPNELKELLQALVNRPQPTPVVNVEVPREEKEEYRPKRFEVEVTERDARGAIKKLVVKETEQ